MAKSIRSRQTNKTAEPYDGFPLFPHASGRRAKTIRGNLHDFGRWGHSKGGEIVPLGDMEASASRRSGLCGP